VSSGVLITVVVVAALAVGLAVASVEDMDSRLRRRSLAGRAAVGIARLVADAAGGAPRASESPLRGWRRALGVVLLAAFLCGAVALVVTTWP
jgi:hypothetical protein